MKMKKHVLLIAVVFASIFVTACTTKAAVIIIDVDNDVSVTSNSTYTVTDSNTPIRAVRAYGTSTVNILGGQIDTFDSVELSHSRISGGTIHSVTLYDDASCDIFGGQIAGISTWGSNHISLYGGNVPAFT